MRLVKRYPKNTKGDGDEAIWVDSDGRYLWAEYSRGWYREPRVTWCWGTRFHTHQNCRCDIDCDLAAKRAVAVDPMEFSFLELVRDPVAWITERVL